MSAGPLSGVEPSFRALARAIVPESDALDESGWASVERVVSNALSERPPAMIRQFRIFLRLLMLLPLLRHGRTFKGLTPKAKAAFLRRLERSPALLLRRGFWGVRTLVYMGYYSLPGVREDIGYRATARGWSERDGER